MKPTIVSGATRPAGARKTCVSVVGVAVLVGVGV